MEGKVAVLGDRDFVMPFSALGVDTFEVGDDGSQIAETAKQILQEKYALVVVAENKAPAAKEIFARVKKLPLPSIVVVPFTTQSTGFATEELGQEMKMATGINILNKT
jgi:vacuolar-type H+-ATPase subunit F/Vma7